MTASYLATERHNTIPAFKTTRTCRGGRHKKRKIASRVGKKKCPDIWTLIIVAPGVNTNNLIKIPINNIENNSQAQHVRFAVWNARSIKAKSKSTMLCEFVIDNQLDVLAITETWLTGGDRDNQLLADLNRTLPNDVFHHTPRLCGRAGGVAVLVRKGLHITFNDTCAFDSFEHMDFNFSSASASVRLIIIYRPPPNKKNNLTPSMFMDDFSSLWRQ